MSNENEMSTAITPVAENNEQVSKIVEERNAVAYLRAEDCGMLSKLKEYLGENLRLYGILNEINARIAKLRKLMKTPAPQIKIPLLIAGIVLMLIGLIGLIGVPS